MIRRTLLVVAATVGAGCAGSPPQFYTLSANGAAAPPAAPTYSVTVGPVSVPEIVDRPQFVVRVAQNQVELAEHARWAEPLKGAIPRVIDFEKFAHIAREVGAIFVADIAHIAGLIAGGAHPSPVPFADVVTTTTHKTLRGPRSGMILGNDEELGKKINSAVFPGLQGGPLMHVIAAKAVAFGEALRPEFKLYAQSVVANAKALAAVMIERGCAIVSGGTDNHLMLVDLRPKGVKGNAAADTLERAGITCNKNGVPFDPLPPVKTSGIRVGSPAGTTRGFGEEEFRDIADMVADVLDGLQKNGVDNNGSVEQAVGERVRALCARFPIYEG